MLAISNDRGANWHPVQTQEEVNFTCVALVNDTIGFIAGTPGLLMSTVDAGKTWHKIDNLPDPADIGAMAVVGKKLYAVGAVGSIYSARIEDILPKAPAKAEKK
jgi:photosystem II stability/assembly factor-like uncharacterized protein